MTIIVELMIVTLHDIGRIWIIPSPVGSVSEVIGWLYYGVGMAYSVHIPRSTV
jgi:hypothetical protein